MENKKQFLQEFARLSGVTMLTEKYSNIVESLITEGSKSEINPNNVMVHGLENYDGDSDFVADITFKFDDDDRFEYNVSFLVDIGGTETTDRDREVGIDGGTFATGIKIPKVISVDVLDDGDAVYSLVPGQLEGFKKIMNSNDSLMGILYDDFSNNRQAFRDKEETL